MLCFLFDIYNSAEAWLTFIFALSWDITAFDIASSWNRQYYAPKSMYHALYACVLQQGHAAIPPEEYPFLDGCFFDSLVSSELPTVVAIVR